jgi:hypothetical protein
MLLKRSCTAISAVLLALFASTFAGGPAQAADTGKHCVVVMGKTAAEPAKKTCANRPDAPELAAATEASWLLMTWYDNWHYDTANGSVGWYGSAGTCDYDGYAVDFANSFQNWNHRISSFKVHGECWFGVIYQSVRPGDGGPPFTGNVDSVGDYFGWEFNDRIEGFFIVK